MTVYAFDATDGSIYKYADKAAAAKAGNALPMFTSAETLASLKEVKIEHLTAIYNDFADNAVKGFKSKEIAAKKVFDLLTSRNVAAEPEPAPAPAKKSKGKGKKADATPEAAPEGEPETPPAEGEPAPETASSETAAKAEGEKKPRKARAKGEPKRKIERPKARLGERSRYGGYEIYSTADGKNPRKPGTAGHTAHQIVLDKPGLTFEEYRAAGGRTIDLEWDLMHGWLEVRDGEKVVFGTPKR